MSGSQVANGASKLRPWVATGGVARVEVQALGPFLLDVEVGAMLRETADRFYFVPSTTVYQVPLVGAVVGLGAAVRFP